MDFAHSHIHSNHHITDSNGMRSAAKIKHQIHCLEIHAYNSLLKAFIAQSEHLTWEREGLLTQIRNELHIANSEHGEILMKINSDETIKQIREQRKMESHSHAHAYNNANTTEHSSASSGNSVIRFKAPPSAACHPRKASMSASNKGLNVTVKYNDNMSTAQFVHGNSEPPKEMFHYDVQLSPSGRASVPKGNNHNKHPYYSFESPMVNNESNFIPPSGSGSVPKGNYHNKQPVYSSESLRLNNKSNFIPPSGSGSVPKGNYHNKHPVYSSESLMINNKSNFIPPSGRGSVPKGNYHIKLPFYSYESPVLNNEFDFNMPSGRGSVLKGNYHNKLSSYSSESPVLNNKSDFIRPNRTDKIINGVENMLFSGENPKPAAIERAKETVHEQEIDLFEAISKLENALEDDDDEALQNIQDYSRGTKDDCPF